MKIILIALLINIIKGEEQYYIKINNKEFEFEFKDTEVANQIKSKLPFTVKMTNLNGNEVYYQFSSESFTRNEKSVKTINMGDIYLYQSNYLVLFYKTFSTSYSYSEIGKLKDASGLDTTIGSSDVDVEWFKKNSETEDTTKSTTKDYQEDNNETTKSTTKDNQEDTIKVTNKEQANDNTDDTTKDTTKDTSEDTIGGNSQEVVKDTTKNSSESSEENDGINENSDNEFEALGFQNNIKIIYLLLTLIIYY